MLTSQVFWRIFIVLVLFALLSVVSVTIGCSPPSDAASVAVVNAWRWRCVITFIGMMAVAVLVTQMIVRRITEPLGVVTRAAKQLAVGAQSISVSVDRPDEPGQIAAVFETVSQRVAARIADLQSEQFRLGQSHDRLAIVLQAMVEGVIAVDRDERILLANTAAMRLLDLKSQRMEEHPLWELVRLPMLQELVKHCMQGENQRRVEFEVPRTQSTVAAVVSRLPGEPCPGAVIVLHDVTDLRRLENLRREFVSNVSHELKTPLAAISAYTETLLDGAIDDVDINRTFVSRIEEQAERLNSLILDLLELARVESDDHAFEVEPVDIGEALQESVAAHQDVARSKNLTLSVRPSEVPVWALADPGGIRTIADNLIDNAINYTPPGGQVDVHWWNDANMVAFEVVDTGVGIAKEHQARIFERFFRVDRARSREVGGTGLGLSIVKHLCQVFDGEIKVVSRVGHGSTFTVRLHAVEPVESLSESRLNRLSQ